MEEIIIDVASGKLHCPLCDSQQIEMRTSTNLAPPGDTPIYMNYFVCMTCGAFIAEDAIKRKE